MSLMGLAEQTYVSCFRMWIPMAKTAALRILGQINRKRTKIVESHTISPPVPITVASWGGGSGPCILLLRSQSAMDTVLIELQMLQIKDRAYID